MSDFLARLAERATGSVTGERLLPAAPFRFAPGEPGIAPTPAAAEARDAELESTGEAPSSRSIAPPRHALHIDPAEPRPAIHRESPPADPSRVHPSVHPVDTGAPSGSPIERIQAESPGGIAHDRSPAPRHGDADVRTSIPPAGRRSEPTPVASRAASQASADPVPPSDAAPRSADSAGKPARTQERPHADHRAPAPAPGPQIVARPERRPAAAAPPASNALPVDNGDRDADAPRPRTRSGPVSATARESVRPSAADAETGRAPRRDAERIAARPSVPIAASTPVHEAPPAPRLHAVPMGPPPLPRPRLEPVARAEPPVARPAVAAASQDEVPAPAGAPVIHVSIGRVDVRAVSSAAPAPRPRPGAAAPAVSLDDYLRARDGGRR